jgi:hypothetical protein
MDEMVRGSLLQVNRLRFVGLPVRCVTKEPSTDGELAVTRAPVAP